VLSRSVFVIVVIGLVLGLVSSPLTAAQQLETIDQSYFGIVEAYFRPNDAQDLGVGWERIIFDWAKFQPTNRSQYKLDAVPEEWLQSAQDGGREVVGLLKSTPFWASGSDKIGAPPKNLDLPIDDPHNYWAAFVRRTVRYYGDEWGVDHWIILNEPDIRPEDGLPWYEFDGDVEDYYWMLKVAYLAAKSVNPDAVIHIAGMAWWVDVSAGRLPYLKRLLEVASNDAEAYEHGFFFDVAMVHTYFGTLNVWNVIRETRDIVWSYGLRDKAFWVGETNAQPSRDPHADLPDAAYNVTLHQQADYIVHSAAMSMAAGAHRFAVYRLYDNHYTPGVTEPWGLVRGDGSRRPAYQSYRTAIRYFSGTTRARRYWSDRSSMVMLEQPDRTLYVMWARGPDPVRFHVLASGADDTATAISVYGATHTVTAEYVPGVEEWTRWFVLETPGAQPVDDGGLVMVEGTPVILAVEGPPRAVWVQVEGAQWRLR
jgi:hypothetical protein